MTDERVDFISDVALKVAAEARSATEVFDILFSHGILAEEEIATCLAAALLVNSLRLDAAISQLESIEEASLSQGDKSLLN